MSEIYVLIYLCLSILIYYLISYYYINKRKQKIISSNKLYNSNKKTNYLSSYINNIESKLFNMGYPYKLNAKKYLFLKYVLSFILTVISFVNYKSLKNSIIYCLVSFFTPNYLINRFKKKEDSMFIEEVRCLTNSIILTLSAYGTLEQALTIAKVSLKNTRFIDEYDKFIYEYKMTGFNLKEASKNLTKRFSSYELSLFVSTLIQGDIEGNLLENMKKFSETLELNYFKYLKKKSQERLIYVTLGTVISLLNIVMIVMYPMLTQILNNLQIIFS